MPVSDDESLDGYLCQRGLSSHSYPGEDDGANFLQDYKYGSRLLPQSIWIRKHQYDKAD